MARLHTWWRLGSSQCHNAAASGKRADGSLHALVVMTVPSAQSAMLTDERSSQCCQGQLRQRTGMLLLLLYCRHQHSHLAARSFHAFSSPHAQSIAASEQAAVSQHHA